MNPMTLKELRDKDLDMATRIEEMLARLGTNNLPEDTVISEKYLTDALTNATHIDGKAVASTNPADVQYIADAKAEIEPRAQNLDDAVHQAARDKDLTNKTPNAGTVPTLAPTPAQQNLQDLIKSLEDTHAQNIKDIQAKDDDINTAKEDYKKKRDGVTIALTQTDTVQNTDELAFLVKWLAMANETARQNMSAEREARAAENKVTKLEQERNILVKTANTNLGEINNLNGKLMALNQKTNANTPNQPANQPALGVSTDPAVNSPAPPQPGTGAGNGDLDDEDLDKANYNDLDPDFDPDYVSDFDDVEREDFESDLDPDFDPDDDEVLSDDAEEEEQEEADTALDLEAEGTAPAPKTSLELETEGTQNQTTGNPASEDDVNSAPQSSNTSTPTPKPSGGKSEDPRDRSDTEIISDATGVSEEDVEKVKEAAKDAIEGALASEGVPFAGAIAEVVVEGAERRVAEALEDGGHYATVDNISVASTGDAKPVDSVASSSELLAATAGLLSEGKGPFQNPTLELESTPELAEQDTPSSSPGMRGPS